MLRAAVLVRHGQAKASSWRHCCGPPLAKPPAPPPPPHRDAPTWPFAPLIRRRLQRCRRPSLLCPADACGPVARGRLEPCHGFQQVCTGAAQTCRRSAARQAAGHLLPSPTPVSLPVLLCFPVRLKVEERELTLFLSY
jgi:hypothetical protein